MDKIPLMQLSPAGGCGCKLDPALLSTLLLSLGTPAAPEEVIVGLAEQDDAAVYQISESSALVLTVDFFTPIENDPFRWGAISAANALSDIYAMGGRPLLALNLVEWPDDLLSMAALTSVCKGANSIVQRAGAHIVGGHSIRGRVPKFGLSVVGLVESTRVLRLANAKPGDRLVLTKPIGTGIVATGLKNGLTSAETAAASYSVMTELNDRASRIAVASGVQAATDVTGFGVLGHLREMCVASGVSAVLEPQSVPEIPGVADLISAGMVPDGASRNWNSLYRFIYGRIPTDQEKALLSDPQTSGGLLLAVPGDVLDDVIAELSRENVQGHLIGALGDGIAGRIEFA